MPTSQMNRRGLFARVFQVLLGIPLVGFAFAALSPLLRLLKPTLGPYDLNQEPDKPADAEQRVANSGQFKKPWDMVEFTFFLKNFEYTPRAENISLVPAFAVRLPDDVVETLKNEAPERYDEATKDGNNGVLIFSRVCPHLGCIFNYFSVDDPRGSEWAPDRIAAFYGFPGVMTNQSYFACPCHFSVYDLKQVAEDLQGKPKVGRVVSGPAPQPPRLLMFEKRGDDYWIVGMEAGGVS